MKSQVIALYGHSYNVEYIDNLIDEIRRAQITIANTAEELKTFAELLSDIAMTPEFFAKCEPVVLDGFDDTAIGPSRKSR